MPIILPVFQNTHCVSLTACAQVKTTDRALIKWLKNEKWGIANSNKSGGKNYVRVSFGDNTGKHFHVDVLKPSHFSIKSNPKFSLTINQIQKKIDHLIGKEVEVDLVGSFEIDISELPENGIIKSLFFQTQLGDVAIKMKGSKLSIKGAPVNEITWQVLKDGKKIGVVIETENLKTRVTENYLTGALTTLEQALKIFVLGKLPNESK